MNDTDVPTPDPVDPQPETPDEPDFTAGAHSTGSDDPDTRDT